MRLHEITEQLGYTEAGGNWIALDKIDRPADRLLRAAKGAEVSGVYLLQTSPSDNIGPKLSPRPVIYVAKANTEQDARRIHKNVWNLGNAPFLIVVLPNQVRVYKGFAFHQDNEKADFVTKPLDNPTADAVRQALAAFHNTEIDSGRIWTAQAANVTTETRVDDRLLKNLSELGDELVIRRQLDKHVAHGLIGKYIYITYLLHRGILDPEWLAKNGLDIDEALSRNATRTGLFALVEALERRFNGKIFSLPDADVPDDETIAFVASVFKGDSPESRQLAFDFQAYDFSYIPIETLSRIYEQFLHRESAGKAIGAYYTPEPLADYLLSEINEAKPLMSDTRVLDPCCGSGVFLVLTYQRMIDIETERRGRPLTPDELRSVLEEGIYGVEREEDACYVAELSLLLTLLSYVDPPDLHHNETFQFPELHHKNIFPCDFFDDDCEFWQKRLRFDWVVGNPPWNEINPNDSKQSIREAPALKWMDDNRQDRPVARYRICDAFAWRVTDVLKHDGYAGLVIHAMTLTNDHCKPFRERFFQAHSVAAVTNFANLFEVLFDKRARVPAATIVYSIASPGLEKQPIMHCGPFAINQAATLAVQGKRKRLWLVTVYENEIQTLEHTEAEEGKTETWKFALWGTYRDRRAVARLRKLFPITLGKLSQEKDWPFNLGLQLRAQGKRDEYEPQLEGLKHLDIHRMAKLGTRLIVPPWILDRKPELRYIRGRGGKAGLRVVRAPHLFLTTNFAAYSDDDFVLPHPQIGLAAPNERDANHLRALSLVLNSSLTRYLLFFHSSSWGIFKSLIGLDEAKAIPVPVMTIDQINELATLHRRMAEAELARRDQVLVSGVPFDIQAAIDEVVERVLGVPEDIGMVAREFMRVKLELNQGKVPERVAGPPTSRDLQLYASRLTRELDDFSGIRHEITVTKALDFILCSVRIGESNSEYTPTVVEELGRISDSHLALWKALGQQRSQWVYVQRSLRVFDGDSFHIMKAPRLIDWTETQALLDSDDIIAEVLAEPGSAE